METPTYADVVKECSTIEEYLAGQTSLSDYSYQALADVKRYLRNQRGIEWSTVYDATNDIYFVDTEGNANNKDNLIKAISLMTVALIFKANAQEATDSMWWDLHKEYKGEALKLLDTAKLDIDYSEDGTISDNEEEATSQVFFKR